MSKERLTEMEFWEAYWERVILPVEMRKSKTDDHNRAILSILDRHLPKGQGLSALEIGGAPGQYLAYVRNTFGYSVSALDLSPIGCQKTRDNFALLHIEGKVYQRDLFGDNSDIPQFDVVYSLGFIEHFSDLNSVVERHLALLKPGGTLMVGAPNFLGINHWFLKRLAPELLALHNLNTMNVRAWKSFRERFALTLIFEGYVGGFEPTVFCRCEERTLVNRMLRFLAGQLSRIFSYRLKFMRRFNSKWFSGYVMGIYRKPG